MRTLVREMVVARTAQCDAHDQRMTQAYQTARLHRVQKMPNIETLYAKRRRRQTPEEQLDVLHQLSAQYGIPLRQRRVTAHG